MKRLGLACLLLLTSVCGLPRASASGSIWMPIHVLIDAGHGGVDGGASYGSLLEKEVNLQIARILYRQLTEKGYRVILNRTGDYALSDENKWLDSPSRHLRDLAQRKHLAAEVPVEMMISIHANWSRNASKHGPLVLYQRNNQSFMLADLIQHALNQLYHTSAEPRAAGSYYLLKHSLCPTIIVEVGFLSNREDRERMTDPNGQEKIAQAIATAVYEYLLLVGEMQEMSE
jgi:N-acetylmuramoyl-L-alanine amidase